jgi:hypothetical protein
MFALSSPTDNSDSLNNVHVDYLIIDCCSFHSTRFFLCGDMICYDFGFSVKYFVFLSYAVYCIRFGDVLIRRLAGIQNVLPGVSRGFLRVLKRNVLVVH